MSDVVGGMGWGQCGDGDQSVRESQNVEESEGAEGE